MILVCSRCETFIGATYDTRVPENVDIVCMECLDAQAKQQVAATRGSPWRD